MDVQMPHCDGYEASRAIRAEGIGPGELPIIALTANAFPEDIAAAREAGMQAHLAKPIALAQLARALQRWLPTQIVDAAPARLAMQLSPIAQSPGLVARWRLRRHETIEAVRDALAAGSLDDSGADEHADEHRAHRKTLEQLVHKLAGSAALFGEPELGEAAAALDRALSHSQEAGTRITLARHLLALGDAKHAEPPQQTDPRHARG
ncbi:MAG: response regulator [Rhizobiales bacterium]|nr:response regulator [Hyphomicrobiales bacterium]